jgi:hypothetical protein
MTFKTAVEGRYFEDYITGDVHEFGSIVAEESEMIPFGQRFEPHSFCGLGKKRSSRSK